MKKTTYLLVVAILHPLTIRGAAPPSFTASRRPAQHVEGELLVKFAGGPRGVLAKRAQAGMNHEVRRNFDRIGWQQIRFPRGMTMAAALERYRNLPGVLAVEPNGLSALGIGRSSAVPNDPQFGQQWNLARIGISNAWTRSTGSSNVVVAVVDSGVNYDHEDLLDNLWRNPTEIPDNGLDDDGNGYVDDVYGIDALDHDADPLATTDFHGTGVAGMIGAVANNGLGLAGVNWSVRLMSIRLVRGTELIPLASRLEAFEYVLLMKSRGVDIRVVNMSWGDNNFYQAQWDALLALDQAGILMVAATLNSSTDVDVAPDYPGNHPVPGLIVVASSDINDALVSGYGRTNVDLAAPGMNVLVLSGPGNAVYSTGSGTSFATPTVTGAAALLAAAYPSASLHDIKVALLDSVDPLPAFTNKVVSHGRLNTDWAMRLLGLASNAPPLLRIHPQGLSVPESSNALFGVVAFSKSPLHYQWKHEDRPLVGENKATLTLSNLVPEHAGAYAVVVSNAFGAVTSTVATLTVLSPPRIVQPLAPLQLGAVAGQPFTLSVETTGTLPIGYRWRHIRASGGSANVTNLVLYTHTCFLTLTAGNNSAGTYTLVLTNAARTTSSVQLTNSVLRLLPDVDADGLPNEWELLYGVADPALDPDLDGLNNLQEYLSGTDPTNALSYLKLDSIGETSGTVGVRFLARSNETYTLECATNLVGNSWSKLSDVVARPVDHPEVIEDPTPGPRRYYRLVTPQQP